MKYIYISLIAVIFSSCQQAQTDQSSLDESPAELVTYYGQEINQDGISNYDEMKLATMETGLSKTKLEGTIVQTCPKKGCWMKMDMGSDTVLVRFKDYSFFVPTEGAEGKSAVIQGNLFVDTISVDMQRHYAEDAGKSKAEIEKITEPKLGLSFLANGVIINK